MEVSIEIKIKELRLKDYGYKKIAKELGISVYTVKYYCKKLNLKGYYGESIPKKEEIKKYCVYCNKELGFYKSKFCSEDCRKKHIEIGRKTKIKNGLEERECEYCHQSFKPNTPKQKFCSKSCSGKSKLIKKECLGCNQSFLTKNINKKFCSDKCQRDSLKKSHLEFVVELIEIHKGTIIPLEMYNGSDQNIKCKCLTCGNEIEKPSKRYIGSYSEGCRCSSISKGENKIKQYLETNNVNFEHQKKFNGLIGLGDKQLSYDFYIPDINLLVEYQGEYHDGNVNNQPKSKLKKQQEHDRRKREYTESNNMGLLEIWYWDFDNIEKILDDKLHKQ